MESHFLKTNFSLSHLLISIITDIFDFLRCFIDILHKYKFHDERVFSVNKTYVTKFCRMEYIPSTAKKKLIITEQTSPLEKNLNSIIAEALSIEDKILFNDEIKYH